MGYVIERIIPFFRVTVEMNAVICDDFIKELAT
jgi:hypothetical protein